MNMNTLKGELVRINTKDGLELQGLLYEPERKAGNAIVHVHAWVGNFYENRFLDYISKEVTSGGTAFLSVNNRGSGIVTDIIKSDTSKGRYIRIGGSLEKFEDCIYDISAATDFVSDRGYDKIILEGHSLGCQKVAFYKYETNDRRVVGEILLAPVDDVAYVKRLLGKNYEASMELAEEMVENGMGDKPVPEELAYYPLMPAKRWLEVSSPKTRHGQVFDYSGELKEIRNANCPVLAIFGSKDGYESGPEEKLETLKNRVKNCHIKLFEGANHWFAGQENELARLIADWIKCHMKSSKQMK